MFQMYYRYAVSGLDVIISSRAGHVLLIFPTPSIQILKTTDKLPSAPLLEKIAEKTNSVTNMKHSHKAS